MMGVIGVVAYIGKKYYLCIPNPCLGGGMVDTRDLDTFFEIIICKRQKLRL